HDVYVEDSHQGKYPLLTAGKISFQLNPLQVWNGDFTVKGLVIEDSETNLKINDAGETNYVITNKERPAEAGSGSLSFALSNVTIKNAVVNYLDLRTLQDLTFSTERLTASIRSAEDVYDIDASGELV